MPHIPAGSYLTKHFLIKAGNVTLFPSGRGMRVVKMASTQEEVFCVTRYAKMNSDLTPWNFFLWGYVKDVVFIPPTANTHSGSAG